MLYAYPMIIKPQDDGYYLAESPDLTGVVVGGDNLPELIQAASDGCAMWLTDAEDNTEAIPVPSEAAQIALQGRRIRVRSSCGHRRLSPHELKIRPSKRPFPFLNRSPTPPIAPG